MTKIASKGTEFQVQIGTAYTAVIQCESVSHSGSDVGHFEAPTLDQSAAGIPKIPTGYVNGGQVQLEGYYDPVEASHQALTDLMTTPAVEQMKTVWSDSANTEWGYDGIVKGFDPSASVTDGLRFSASVEVDGLPTYPT